MTNEIIKFLEESSKNKEIQEELIKANENYLQSLIDIGKKHGIELTVKDIVTMLNADKNHDGRISDDELSSIKLEGSEVSEDELAAVAGGTYVYNKKTHHYSSDCWCGALGGGSGDQFQEACACIGGGAGSLTRYGKQEAAAGRIDYVGSSSTPVAMACACLGSSFDKKSNR